MPNRKRRRRRDVATLTIRNVPDDLYELLKQSAKQHRRSINSEAIFLLERASGFPVDPAEFLERVRPPLLSDGLLFHGGRGE